ncbi:SDR family oxidoreductase [Aurantiacibacter aquimixticola]|uniref:NAD-dependent epimerase/dehydratase family protein n=1 Tax=Aurantiacibacter aquimixticola TaxID=1958945 RepID=A0A419RTV7_9SPHN|nr:SDR family oxidoreductase [Aurantiacibacter aquimixticola]RJY09218.1 NAD-dependent epimerase/dehydratase family protein [Aurantiacibacter aquimixticola]
MLNILVTGAAGLIGGEVCARLAAHGHRVTAMVRRNPEVRGNDGALVEGIETLSGDVTQPLMGLEPSPQDVVIHCAASLEFDASEGDLRAINIEGTRNALAFAEEAGAAFLHVSTAYVCGMREGAIAEGPVPEGTQFTNRYEASKAAAERVVAESGLPFAVARPSIVLGDSESGAIRDFPSLCNVFRLMARGKVTVFPAADGSTLDLVPIDHVAGGIVALAERMGEANGGHYHLVANDPLPAAALAHGVARVAHFPDPRVVAPEHYNPAELRGAERMLAARMLGTFGAYFTRSPRFEDARFREVTGLACAPTDDAWLDRLIAYGIERGYLPSA